MAPKQAKAPKTQLATESAHGQPMHLPLRAMANLNRWAGMRSVAVKMTMATVRAKIFQLLRNHNLLPSQCKCRKGQTASRSFRVCLSAFFLLHGRMNCLWPRWRKEQTQPVIFYFLFFAESALHSLGRLLSVAQCSVVW